MQNKRYDYKFTEEDFAKLSQLDRIEYRQRENRIEERHKGSIASGLFWTFMVLLGFLFLVAIAGYGSFGRDFFITILRILYIYVWVFFITYFLCLVGDAINYEKYKKEMKELKDSYFKIEVKKK